MALTMFTDDHTLDYHRSGKVAASFEDVGTMTEDAINSAASALELATELTIAWLSNSNTRASAEDVPVFLRQMYESVSGLTGAGEGTSEPTPAPADYTLAVSVRKSLSSPDHIISMIDGKPYKTLRRHLNTHGLTPDLYRERYGLKPDYPMVAPNYSASRRDMAHKIGLGRKPKQAEPEGAGTQGHDQQHAAPQPPARRKLKLPKSS